MLYPYKPTIMSVYGLLNPYQLTEKKQSTPSQKRSSTARSDMFTWKSASEHNLSGVGCNFRVSQGSFPGARKIQDFPGSSRAFRVCWLPWLLIMMMRAVWLNLDVSSVGNSLQQESQM